MALPVKVLNQCNPAYNEQLLAEQRALYEGGDSWHAMINTWLPRHPQETYPLYKHRKERATYENNAGPIADLLAGGLFTRPPQIEEYEGEWVQPFFRDVDKLGHDLNAWLEARLLDAMQGQRVYCWVNLPDKEVAAQNRMQQEASGQLDPFLMTLKAIDVIDWGHDEYGRLKWLMHKQTDSVRGSIESARVTRCTWTFIDDQVIRRWQWIAADPREHEPKEHEEIGELAPIAHGFGEIPIVEMSLKDSMFIMGKLRDPAVALLRSQNDLDWALYRAAHAILWIRMKWDPEQPLMAPGAYYKLGRDRDGTDEMGYAEPSGASFEHQSQRVTQQRHGMFRVVHQMAQSYDPNTGSRAQLSGESKAQDWKATEIVLSAYASTLRPFISNVLRLVSRVIDGNGSAQIPLVKGMAGWHQEDLLPFLTATSLAQEALMLSETFHKVVAKEQVRRVLPHLSEEQVKMIEDEIDKADIDLSLYIPDKADPAGPSGFDTAPRDQDGDGVVDEQ